MKFGFVTIHVTELEKGIAFYETVLGLQVMRRFQAGPNQEIAFVGSGAQGETQIELICHSDTDSISHDSHLTLGFQVDSLDQAMEDVKAKGVEIQSGPFQPNPNTRFCFILDPNGVTVQLTEFQ